MLSTLINLVSTALQGGMGAIVLSKRIYNNNNLQYLKSLKMYLSTMCHLPNILDTGGRIPASGPQFDDIGRRSDQSLRANDLSRDRLGQQRRRGGALCRLGGGMRG